MFWGLALESGKRYTQTVENSFHISMAALESVTSKGKQEATSVMIHAAIDKSEFMLCTLEPPYRPQQFLDLNFTEGEEVTFLHTGPGVVHLTGYLVPEEERPFEDSDFSEPDDSDDELDDSDEDSDIDENAVGNEHGENSDESDSDAEDMGSSFVQEPKSKKAKTEKIGGREAILLKEESKKPESKKSEVKKPKSKKRERKKSQLKKEESTPVEPSTPSGENALRSPINDPQKIPSANKKLVLPGGVVAQELKKGHGAEVKMGKMIHVYYSGKLLSGKQFDACLKGKPFKFKLGKQEVIKGLESGVAGMKVGGKRKLTIPPSQGYGSTKMGPIPANSALLFEVELKAVS